ncbi:hypothetical protein, partial [Nonomuraea sp. NPDC049028]|uniref:hypothetical protein n=1 Tax=Nonomuraea sp. NPDC049028 TaxID=3364348 RepID=UPI003712574A
LGDRKRQTASVLVWTQVTQGEHLFAPRPIEAAQPSGVQKAWRHEDTWYHFQAVRPKRHYAHLRRILLRHADQMAEHIDGMLDG